VREDGEVEGRGIEWGIERGKGRGQAFVFRNLWTLRGRGKQRFQATDGVGGKKSQEESGSRRSLHVRILDITQMHEEDSSRKQPQWRASTHTVWLTGSAAFVASSRGWRSYSHNDQNDTGPKRNKEKNNNNSPNLTFYAFITSLTIISNK
jgi:hypothetical protein